MLHKPSSMQFLSGIFFALCSGGAVSRVNMHDRRVRRLKGKLLMHTIADALEIAHASHAISSWWAELHPERMELDTDRKWKSYFDGVLPRGYFIEKLIVEAPCLKEFFDSPLWVILSKSRVDVRDANRLACCIKIDGRRLQDHSGRINLTMERICAVPSLKKIPYLIAILRSDAPRLAFHRAWLHKNFTLYFLLACLGSPTRYVAEDLFQVIDGLVGASPLDRAVLAGWPTDAEEFLLNMLWFACALLMVRKHAWAKSHDESVLFLWCFYKNIKNDQHYKTMELLRDGPRPNRVRVAFRRAKLKISEIGFDEL